MKNQAFVNFTFPNSNSLAYIQLFLCRQNIFFFFSKTKKKKLKMNWIQKKETQTKKKI